MKPKHVSILFAILLVIGISTATINSMQQSVSVAPTVTPTPVASDLFNPGQGSKTTQTNGIDPLFNTQQKQVPQQQIIPTPTPRQIKQYRQFPGILATQELSNKKAIIETNKGNIEFEIFPEATKAVSSFIFLVRDGFYDGLIFHRVEPGFVIQGGDPTGSGSGGPGYTFEDEPVVRNYDKGIVAMANSGPNTNGSQFFIMLDNKPDLPKKYTIFGKVISGQDVVSQIRIGDVMQKITIENFVSSTPTPTPTVNPTITPTPTP